jgi:MFS family permease
VSVGTISKETQAELDPTGQLNKVVASSLIGTALEYYDFFIFGTASAVVFPRLFFPNLSSLGGILAAYATLSIPFLVRPIGGAVFGHFGDTIGRKKMLIVTLVMMGLSTFGIGLVPAYDTIGFWAPLLVITFRVIQGVALSGEWGGAAIMIVEHSPPQRRGFYSALTQIGNPMALFVSALMFAIIPTASLLNGAWRIPFLLSIVALGIGLYIRTHVQESPIFASLKESGRSSRTPFLDILRRGKRPVLMAAGTRAGEAVLAWIVIAFLLSYATRTLGFSSQTVLYGILTTSGLAMITFPIFGAISDRVGRRAVFLFGAGTTAIFAFPFFWLIDSGSPALFYIAVVFGYAVSVSAMYALEPVFFSEAFDTSVRFSGISTGFNIGGVIGGVTPMIGTSLVALAGGKSWALSIFIMVAGLITVVCVCMISERAGQSLADDVLPAARSD